MADHLVNANQVAACACAARGVIIKAAAGERRP
jgi:hypothetical protein